MIVIGQFYLPDSWAIILISTYSFGIVINFVRVLLPFCCKKLSYDYKSSNNIKNIPISSDFKNIKNDQTSDEQIYPNKDDIMEPINDNEDEAPYYNNTNQGYDNNYGNSNEVGNNMDFIQYPSSQ